MAGLSVEALVWLVCVQKVWCDWSVCGSSGVVGLCVEALVWLVCVQKLWCGWSVWKL